MPWGPTQDRFQPKYTVKTRAPTGPAIGGGGGGGGGGGMGTHAAMARNEQRTIARFIRFLRGLRNSAYKKSLGYTKGNRVSPVKLIRVRLWAPIALAERGQRGSIQR